MQELIHLGVATVVVLAVFGAGARVLKRRQQKREADRQTAAEKVAENKARKFRDTAANVGNRIFNSLRDAAEMHPGFKDGVRFAKVMRHRNNAGCYTITCCYQEPGIAQHEQATYQINIPMTEVRGREIRVLEGNYGPTVNYPLTDAGVGMLLARMVPMTKRWGLSPEAA